MTLIVKKSFPTALRRFAEGDEVEAQEVGGEEYVGSLVDAGYLARKSEPKPSKPPGKAPAADAPHQET